MKLSLNNFLYGIKQIVTGGGLNADSSPENDAGFLKAVSLNTVADLRTIDGLTLTGATVPAVLRTETNGLTVAVAASQTAAGSFVWTVPLDYDENTDQFSLNVIAGMDGAVDAPTLDATIYRKRPGVALSADLNPTASAALGESTAWKNIVSNGKGLKAGDTLTINLVTGAHTTNAVSIHAVQIRYRSTLVAYNETDKTGFTTGVVGTALR